jgi:hypothetical protein
MSQVLAKRNSGYYATKLLNPQSLQTVVEVLNYGLTEPRVLRQLLQNYLPANNPLSTLDLFNFRVRAKVWLAKHADGQDPEGFLSTGRLHP